MHKYSVQMSCLHRPNFNGFLSPAHYLIGMNVGCRNKMFGRCYHVCWAQYCRMGRWAEIQSLSRWIIELCWIAFYTALLIQKLLHWKRIQISSAFCSWGDGTVTHLHRPWGWATRGSPSSHLALTPANTIPHQCNGLHLGWSTVNIFKKSFPFTVQNQTTDI